tara:strand:- start:92 stop:229 length:138 start_codon:yes stop_codon:yes gene_type:complete
MLNAQPSSFEKHSPLCSLKRPFKTEIQPSVLMFWSTPQAGHATTA